MKGRDLPGRGRAQDVNPGKQSGPRVCGLHVGPALWALRQRREPEHRGLLGAVGPGLRPG